MRIHHKRLIFICLASVHFSMVCNVISQEQKNLNVKNGDASGVSEQQNDKKQQSIPREKVFIPPKMNVTLSGDFSDMPIVDFLSIIVVNYSLEASISDLSLELRRFYPCIDKSIYTYMVRDDLLPVFENLGREKTREFVTSTSQFSLQKDESLDYIKQLKCFVLRSRRKSTHYIVLSVFKELWGDDSLRYIRDGKYDISHNRPIVREEWMSPLPASFRFENATLDIVLPRLSEFLKKDGKKLFYPESVCSKGATPTRHVEQPKIVFP